MASTMLYLIVRNDNYQWNILIKMVQNFRYDGLYHVKFDSQEYNDNYQ